MSNAARSNAVGTMRKINAGPAELPGRKWYVIALWTEYDAASGMISEDIWISGELDDFVREYILGVRDFGMFSIADGSKVSVNEEAIDTVLIGAIPHVPERRMVADTSSGGIDVRVTAGYGQVVGEVKTALLLRQNPPDRPGITVQFWAPRCVEEL